MATAKGFLQLAKQHSAENNTVSCYLDSAVEEIDQIDRIITDFLALVHPKAEGLQFINLNDLIADVVILVGNVATMYNIAVHTQYTELPLCLLDTKQVKHALLNVLQNAIQAMPQGGLLQVDTVFDTETEEIRISISDTGNGINRENLSRIFNPFYSTKVEGSGLGLTLTNRIVTHHDGHIEVYSEEGKGTTVRLCFPTNQ
ncbi:MAG: ATP-binding protein [Clostridiales bacterium]|nr:ATP-binding protein [Clostridiales bacterium]